jgi:uncharacterized hydantoinase/oxoprolinase family protein
MGSTLMGGIQDVVLIETMDWGTADGHGSSGMSAIERLMRSICS